LDEFPDLLHLTDYSLCQRVGKELKRHVAMLITKSVRRAEGNNIAVFQRDSLSDPDVIGVVTFELDPRTGGVKFNLP
jgi:hypothetical protein